MIRRLVATLLVLGGCLALGAEIARACGDKFLIFGGAPGVRRYSSMHPSRILVVKRGAGLAIDSSELTASLGRAGHRVKEIKSYAALAQTLADGKYDAVLVDLADAKAAATDVGSSAGQPLLVTVLSNPTAAQLAASQEYACLRTPDKATNLLKALDDLLSQRKAARRQAR